jgi:Ca2+-binding EF-hand superfamily protein
MGNPYVERTSSVTNFSDITKRVIEACKFKSAANGLRGLKVEFKKLDKNGDGFIDPVEFKFGLKAYGIEVTEDELKALMKYFDTNRDGKISLNEMIHAMRSGSLNERRAGLVEKLYSWLQS